MPWLAGGGAKPGMVLGETNDYRYNIVADPVHVHDLQATIPRCLGIDHKGGRGGNQFGSNEPTIQKTVQRF